MDICPSDYRRVDNLIPWQYLLSPLVEKQEWKKWKSSHTFLRSLVLYPKEYFFCIDSCTVKAAPSVKICKWPARIFPPSPTGQGILNLNLWWKKTENQSEVNLKPRDCRAFGWILISAKEEKQTGTYILVLAKKHFSLDDWQNQWTGQKVTELGEN